MNPTKPLLLLVLVPLLMTPLAHAQTELAPTRAALEAMSPVEKEALAEKRTRFDALPTAEKERLRQLNSDLTADPQANELRGIMSRYYEWLKTLTSDQRAQLLSTPTDQRLAKIQKLLAEQEQQRFRRLADQRLSPEDMEQVYHWTTTYIRSRETRLIAVLPQERRREIEQIPEEAHRWRTLFWQLRSHDLPDPILPTQEEIDGLVSTLSEEAKQIFAAATDDLQRKELVQRWIRASMFSRLVQSVSEEDLMEFMQNELDPRTRARLESLPREAMQGELRRQYLFHKFRGFGGGPPRFGGPGGRPPPDWEEGPRDDGRRDDERDGRKDDRRRGPPQGERVPNSTPTPPVD